MKIIVSARHFDLTKALKDFAHEKLATLKKYFDQVIEVDLVLSVVEHAEKPQFAEATLWASGASLHSECSTSDMYASITGVVDKLEVQLKRYKQKLRDKRKANNKTKKGRPSEAELVAQAQAIADWSAKHSVVSVDHDGGKGPHVIRESDFVLQPLTVEEASLQLQELNQPFVVFSNLETNSLGVVYRRPDGEIGWIEARTAVR